MTEEQFAKAIEGKNLTDLEKQVIRKSVGLPADLPEYLSNPRTGLEKAHLKAMLMQIWAEKMA